jgi:hypothetical protein
MTKLAFIAAVAAVGFTTAALADKASAPGQDRACLVTTSGGASGAITDTKWLPRKAATKQADNDTTFVGTNPIVATKAGCDSLDPS